MLVIANLILAAIVKYTSTYIIQSKNYAGMASRLLSPIEWSLNVLAVCKVFYVLVHNKKNPST